MKEPKLSDLKIDLLETKRVRKAAKSRKIKITINLDLDSLAQIKRLAEATGVPYQRLVNKMLRDSLSAKKSTESRLERIERELKEMKRKLAA